MKSALLAVLVLIPACPPAPTPPTPPDATDAAPFTVDATPPPTVVDAGGSDCDRGCTQLRTLGCAEGAADAGCPAACTHAQAAHLTQWAATAPACWASSTTKTAARACGGVTCP